MKQAIKNLFGRIRSYFVGDILQQIKNHDNSDAIAQTQLALSYRYRMLDGKPLPSLSEVGFQRYSQTDEDGILLFIFAVIGTSNRTGVEICGGDGIECNLANLIINHGWYGLMLDGNSSNINRGKAFYQKNSSTHVYPPKLVTAWVTKDNVNQLISENGIEGEIDLLSLDMDGVDYWILKELSVIQPRVIVLEYQDILGPERSVTVPYKNDFNGWEGPATNGMPNFCGASLIAFKRLLESRGYGLVGCNRLGFNAFFVKKELLSEALPECTVESCFTHPKVIWGIRERYPTIASFPWEEV